MDKHCNKCGETKPVDQFDNRPGRSGKWSHCKECRRTWQRLKYKERKEENPFHHRVLYLQCAANTDKLPFDLDGPYLGSIWTGKCAISGIPIEINNSRWEENHAEMDKIIPELGYTKGNVQWCSRKFNRIKGGASYEDIKTLYEWFISIASLKKEYG